MPLSCSCPDWDPEPGEHIWYEPAGYIEFAARRRQRCWSCNELISIGALCSRIGRFRIPDTDVECSIYGEDGEIPLANKYLCERCSDIYYSLSELGFCVSPMEDQRELLKEYVETYQRTAEVRP